MLEKLRQEIDKIDDELFLLIDKRMSIVKQIGDLKNKTHQAIYRPEREKSILKRLYDKNRDKSIVSNKDIEAIFMQIFAVSRNLELPQKIAYLGPKGSFTHQVAESRFGLFGNYVSLNSIEDVFNSVSLGMTKFGVIPIENNSNGIVGETISGFNKFNVSIIAEVLYDISHCFVSNCDNIEDITTIYSKDIALTGCLDFLKNYNFINKKLVEVESTAKAAQIVADNKNSAAICSKMAAKIYGVSVLFENIQTLKSNKTRFFIISNFYVQKHKNSKTSILAILPNKPGELVNLLLEFGKNSINLAKIKSHIISGKSMFFIEFDGHMDDNNVKDIIKNNNIKLLGSYPKELDDI